MLGSPFRSLKWSTLCKANENQVEQFLWQIDSNKLLQTKNININEIKTALYNCFDTFPTSHSIYIRILQLLYDIFSILTKDEIIKDIIYINNIFNTLILWKNNKNDIIIRYFELLNIILKHQITLQIFIIELNNENNIINNNNNNNVIEIICEILNKQTNLHNKIIQKNGSKILLNIFIILNNYFENNQSLIINIENKSILNNNINNNYNQSLIIIITLIIQTINKILNIFMDENMIINDYLLLLIYINN